MKPISRQTKKLKFAKLKDVPATYRELCSEVWLPRPIRNKSDQAAATEVVDRLSVFENLNKDQLDYLDMVSDVLGEYEGEIEVEIPPLKMLAGLLEENNLSGADLSKILVGSRNLGPMILRGDRRLTIDHARALANYFKLRADAFV